MRNGRRFLLGALLLAACTPTSGDYADHGEGRDLETPPAGKADGLPPAFDPHWIMDDWLFTDTESLDADDVQRFLEQNPYGNRSWLADLEVDGRRFADALVEAAKAVDINPLVLLARAQVEQSLVSKTTRPSESAVSCAFGCGCDCSELDVCDMFAGLDRQLGCVGRTLRRWYDASVDETGRWQSGQTTETNEGTAITPRNHATASLYQYTPWVLERTGGNWLVWNVTNRFYYHFQHRLGIEFARSGGLWNIPDAEAFIGDACERHADCQYPNGHCLPQGFCTVRCAGSCPTAAEAGADGDAYADTFCVPRADTETTYGICVPLAAAENRECRDVPGSVVHEVRLYRASRTDIPVDRAEVCYPQIEGF
jgi:hypothetical protein